MTLIDDYYDVIENKSDQRVKDWFLMSGPVPTALLCLLYVYIVKVIGPKLMENREPFVLRRAMIYYNLFQVLLSAWLVYTGLKYGWWNDYSFRCQPIDYSDNPRAVNGARGCWLYYIAKFTEFFDTFFFVLRKKNNQITNLHVIHHGIMPFMTWWGVKFIPGGHLTLFGVVNSFIHVIMYGYYLLAALGPQMQPYLWWKKYLTTMQMVQFVVLSIHAGQLLFIECDYPKVFVWVGLGLGALFFLMFGNFYVESYIKKRNKKAA